MSELAKIEIDKATVKAIIDKQVQAAIVRELDGTKDLLFERIVEDLVNSRVNDRGEITRDSWSKTTLVEWLCREQIKKAAQEAVEQFFAREAPEIQKAVAKELTRQKAKFAKAAVDAMIGAATSSYRYNFKIEVDDGG
jgi:hypothetical protein